eukprot:6492168-Amphidinium_carterae.7
MSRFCRMRAVLRASVRLLEHTTTFALPQPLQCTASCIVGCTTSAGRIASHVVAAANSGSSYPHAIRNRSSGDTIRQCTQTTRLGERREQLVHRGNWATGRGAEQRRVIMLLVRDHLIVQEQWIVDILVRHIRHIDRHSVAMTSVTMRHIQLIRNESSAPALWWYPHRSAHGTPPQVESHVAKTSTMPTMIVDMCVYTDAYMAACHPNQLGRAISDAAIICAVDVLVGGQILVQA